MSLQNLNSVTTYLSRFSSLSDSERGELTDLIMSYMLDCQSKDDEISRLTEELAQNNCTTVP